MIERNTYLQTIKIINQFFYVGNHIDSHVKKEIEKFITVKHIGTVVYVRINRDIL